MTLVNRLNASDLFGQLRPEDEQEVRKATAHKSETLEWLLKGFEIYSALAEVSKYRDVLPPGVAQRIIRLKNVAISSGDVTALSILLPNHYTQNESEYHPTDFSRGLVMGIYLNACIRKCTDNRIFVYTGNYGCFPEEIGGANKDKQIIVVGDAGDRLGNNMVSGEIEVRGDVRGSQIAENMKGGVIRIRGCADVSRIGERMEGGEVYISSVPEGANIFGLLETTSKPDDTLISGPEKPGGTVYYQGKPIFSSGRRVE